MNPECYIWQRLSFAERPPSDGSDVFGQSAETHPPPGYELHDWSPDNRGDVLVCWRKVR